ncbi:MAG TPA: hypothetical protein PKU91_10340 [Phycisphaerales bacterium]|nr:hypothetical protein [Phycisphaerales bacterium]
MRHRRLSFQPVFVVPAIVAVGSLVLGGCANKAQQFRSNPTPEIDSVSQTHEEIDNRLTVTNDTNARMINRDIGYVLMLDRPSRLTPHPSGW